MEQIIEVFYKPQSYKWYIKTKDGEPSGVSNGEVMEILSKLFLSNPSGKWIATHNEGNGDIVFKLLDEKIELQIEDYEKSISFGREEIERIRMEINKIRIESETNQDASLMAKTIPLRELQDELFAGIDKAYEQMNELKRKK
jgi:hypothetical protein